MIVPIYVRPDATSNVQHEVPLVVVDVLVPVLVFVVIIVVALTIAVALYVGATQTDESSAAVTVAESDPIIIICPPICH